MDSRRDKRIIFHYISAGFTHFGEKIAEVPVISLAVKAGKKRARGLAIIDTGFDGGIYPNIQVLEILEGLKPERTVYLENPLYGLSEFEIYSVDTFIYYNGEYIGLGEAKVYAPTQPEMVSEEVTIGREFLNKFKLVLDPVTKVVIVEIP